MAKKKQSLFEDIAHIAARLPWQVSLILASASYFGFPTAVGADINLMSSGASAKLPRLTLESSRTIANIEELNLAVVESKNALVRFRSQNQISKLHVFIKAPSVFAMVLGHRLNGVCAIQLNDWVDGQYQPTALLDS